MVPGAPRARLDLLGRVFTLVCIIEGEVLLTFTYIAVTMNFRDHELWNKKQC